MQIEVLYFEGCPSWQQALEHLRAALIAEQIEVQPILRLLTSDEDAQAQRFTGSPSIRVDGQELFPVTHEQYALGCRVYHTPEGLRGWPSAAMIREALRAHIKQE